MTTEQLTMDAGEAASMLGISRRQVYRLMDTGEVPALQVGHARRIIRRAFLAKYPELEPDPEPATAA